MEQVTIEQLRSKYTAQKYKDMTDAELARRYTQATGIKVAGFEPEVQTPDLAGNVSISEDLSKAIGSAATSALAGILGLPGAVTNTVEMAADALGVGSRGPDERAFGFPEAQAAIENAQNRIRSSGLPGAEFLAGTSPTYEPQTRAGRYTKTGGELAASGGAGSLRKMATHVVAPTVLSEGGREAFEGSVLEAPAQIAGLLAGGKILDVAENTISGGKVDPRRLEAVKTLREAGLEPTAGQATGQPTLAFAEEATQAGRAIRQAPIDQFTDAAINTAVPPSLRSRVQFAPDMQPQEKMAALRATITSTMDQLAARNSFPVSTDLVDEIAQIAKDYKGKISTSDKTPYFKKLSKDLRNLVGGGELDGSTFQRIRSDLSEQTKKDAITRGAAVKAIKALEDAMGKQIAKGRNKEDILLYRDVRKGYSDLMVLEAAAKSNKKNDFNISPSALANAARNKDAQSYIYGRDTFSELYRAANTVLTRADNPSGSAGTLKAMFGPAQAMGAAASASLATGMDPYTAGALVLGAPVARNRALISDPVQRYFKNTMRPGQPAPTTTVPGILVGLQELQQQLQ